MKQKLDRRSVLRTTGLIAVGGAVFTGSTAAQSPGERSEVVEEQHNERQQFSEEVAVELPSEGQELPEEPTEPEFPELPDDVGEPDLPNTDELRPEIDL
ncbi:hypothetical protein [Natrononativus amylolyticus]|uniref:hypothetical protein n=1 Tax=Natrononativus amylolyticus TaxID=2963434 RepID=UPI0020CF950B|nr:hypothetical protein [Natrononativus amylolyticus]